jgi:hypothetical protein
MPTLHQLISEFKESFSIPVGKNRNHNHIGFTMPQRPLCTDQVLGQTKKIRAWIVVLYQHIQCPDKGSPWLLQMR